MRADARLAALRRKMADEDLEAVLVTDVSNVRYVTGFENVFDDHANVACLVTSQIARVFTDSRYAEAVGSAAEGTPWSVKVPECVYIALCDELSDDGVVSLALESSVPYGRFRFISEKFGGKVIVIDGLVERLRQVKEASEIERIAAAAALTDRAFEHILGFITPGLREDAIALELEVFMRSNGSGGVAFEPIVASGPNSARPHAVASSREIAEGDLVVLDFGARISGYCADMTRTVVVGTPTARQKEVYAAVLEANLAGIDGVKPGVPGAAIDRIAREVLIRRGLGDHFAHGLGHGVGIDVHELPSLGPRGRESVLSGSVVTVEPGAYIPGFGGVRIEDLVVVEDAGCRVLTSSPKDLTEIRVP